MLSKQMWCISDVIDLPFRASRSPQYQHNPPGPHSPKGMLDSNEFECGSGCRSGIQGVLQAEQGNVLSHGDNNRERHWIRYHRYAERLITSADIRLLILFCFKYSHAPLCNQSVKQLDQCYETAEYGLTLVSHCCSQTNAILYVLKWQNLTHNGDMS